MADQPPIPREQIIGQRLAAILQVGESASGIDLVTTFYRLESGLTFFLPFEDSLDFFGEEPPLESKPLTAPALASVVGQRIVEVLRPLPGISGVESPYLMLENGLVVFDVMGAHEGTGGAGLFILQPEDWDRARFCAFWL
ncbi:hypothetical protein [Anatilimnocola floriformis]|uniref:hypothetical protein n=1 Tax=Anatilimnocola floriformis TaxID=2948575 RepID=UPI0020C40D89|nr:hypothetical protein [Anatilimnocola floriformis]